MEKNKFQVEFHEVFREANEKMKQAKRIALVAHSRPDEDAVGAQLAMYEYLKEQLKKDVDVISDPKRSQKRVGFLPYIEALQSKENLDGYDLIVAFDSGEINHVYPEGALKDTKATVINMDHHPQKEDDLLFGDIQIVNKELAATNHLLYYFFIEVGANITKSMATNMLAGIAYDTGRFRHSNTTPEVLEVVSELLKTGAPLTKIINNIYNQRSFAALQLWGRALSRARINPKTQMVISVITKKDLEETRADVEDLSGLISIINSVEGSRFSLLLTQEAADTIKGSLRSEEYKGVDVSRIARLFGGGGHKLASGFTVTGELSKSEAGWQIK